MTYLLLVLGFVLLIVGGNLLVDGSVLVARRLKVSSLLIGLVLVGFGTSMPELFTSLIAACEHVEGIAVGNVVGSNIANILLVLGVAALIRTVPIHKKSFRRDGLFLAISTAVLVFALLWGYIGFSLGLCMCATLTFYTIYSYKTEKKIAKENVLEDTETVTKQAAWFGFIKAIAGIALTVGGAKLLVASASDLAANIWHVDNKIIGLTVVAVGTSLPELATSVVASLKKQSDVALGNVIGSNIYNALFILGLTAVFVPIQVPEAMLIDMMVMVMATLALLWIGFCRKYVARWMGLLFVIVYFVYVVFLGVSQ